MPGEGQSAQQASVAVLIVAYKSRDTIPEVIAALDAQTVRPARVRLLENGSPSEQRIDPETLPDWVEFVESAENLGFARGNNRLADGLNEDWLLFLNPDAFPEPDWIEQLLAATERWPHASLFGSTQLAHGSPGVLDGAGDVYHFTGLPYRAGYGRAIALPPEGEVFGPCGAATLIRRSVFEALCGFDEDYFCYVEDVDLAARARLNGEVSVQVRDAVVSHVGYGSSARRSEFATYHGARNRLWTFMKVTPGWLLWVLMPIHLGVTLLLWLSAARFSQFGVFARALEDAWKGRAGLFAKRSTLQAARKITVLDYARALSWNPLNLLSRAPDVRPKPGGGQR